MPKTAATIFSARSAPLSGQHFSIATDLLSGSSRLIFRWVFSVSPGDCQTNDWISHDHALILLITSFIVVISSRSPSQDITGVSTWGVSCISSFYSASEVMNPRLLLCTFPEDELTSHFVRQNSFVLIARDTWPPFLRVMLCRIISPHCDIFPLLSTSWRVKCPVLTFSNTYRRKDIKSLHATCVVVYRFFRRACYIGQMGMWMWTVNCGERYEAYGD
jgi:hypothetical protein